MSIFAGLPTIYGLSVLHSFYVMPGTVLLFNENRKPTAIHPWLNLETGEYRPPWFTRCCLGVRELERDRRKYAA